MNIRVLKKNDFLIQEDDEGLYFVDNAHFFVIPWAVIGIAMAKGALAFLGGKIIESVFFPDTEEEIKIDFSLLINTLIEEFKNILKTEIRDNELRKLNADIESIQQNIIHYMNSQDGVDRLEDATIKVSAVVSHLRSLNKLGFPSYSIALNLQIAITQERVNIYGKNEKRNIIEIIDRAEDHLDKMRDEWFQWSNSRFTNPRADRRGIYYYEYEGNTRSYNIPQLRKWFADHGAPLKDDISNYDEVFSWHLSLERSKSWNTFSSLHISPVTKDMWRQWKKLRKKMKRELR